MIVSGGTYHSVPLPELPFQNSPSRTHLTLHLTIHITISSHSSSHNFSHNLFYNSPHNSPHIFTSQLTSHFHLTIHRPPIHLATHLTFSPTPDFSQNTLLQVPPNISSKFFKFANSPSSPIPPIFPILQFLLKAC